MTLPIGSEVIQEAVREPQDLIGDFVNVLLAVREDGFVHAHGQAQGFDLVVDFIEEGDVDVAVVYLKIS